MSITIGQKAPDFTLVSIGSDGPELVTLSDELGKENILLLFFPMAFTGVCTDEMCAISEGLQDYSDLNCKVYGISGDGPFSQQAWAEKEKITIPLLSDYEHEVANAYGIAYEQFLPDAKLIMGGVPKRSAFLLDKNGTVKYAQVENDPHDLPDFAAIKAKLAELS